MAAPTIPNGETQFFPIIYEGNGGGQRVGKFVPFTDNGTIANSLIFNNGDSPRLNRTPSGTGTSRRIYTLSFWAKPSVSSTVSDERYIINAGSYGNDDGIVFKYPDRTMQFWINGTSTANLKTNRTFEDSSKFYHILVAVDTTQSTASDRVKIYVDGDQITSFSVENYPSQNYDGNWGNAVLTNVGSSGSPNRYYNGYLAEVNYVDGTALTPDTFGLTDTSTGRWIPKALTGITYGTNGFRLQFGSSSALGDDTSGNENDFSVTNLVAGDQTTDSPTQNFNTLGSAFSGVTLSQGNLTVNTGTSGSYIQAVGQPAFGVATGKWYWEVKVTTVGKGLYGWKDDGSQGGSQANQGATSASGNLSTGSSGSFSAGSWFIDMDYDTEVNYTTVSTNDVLMFAIDLDNGKGYCGKNGTFFNSADPANGTGSIGGCHRANGINKFYPCANRLDTASVGEFNFGQRSFAYTPPTGFLPLQQDNLPETAKGVSGLVWIKNRDASSNHSLQDSSRGSTQMLYPDLTSQQYTVTDGVQKFLKGGFQMEDDTLINTSGNSYVSWNWVANGGTTATNNDGSITSTVQVNTTAGFSIVRWTGGGSAGTVGHGLSQTPEWMFYKRTNATGDGWVTYHKDQDASPANGSMQIQSDGTYGADSTLWNNTAPTSSVISIGTYGMQSSEERTAWVWHGIEGFSKFGKYVGTGFADGPFVYLGFRPAFVCIKRLTAGYHWTAKDIARDPINPMTKDLKWNLTAADSVDANNAVDFLSNGFKIRTGSSGGTNYNGSGATHIYMAWAEHPFVGDGTSPVTAR